MVAQMSGVQHLTLNITVDLNTNDTEYTCRVMDQPSFQESSSITIQVGGNTKSHYWDIFIVHVVQLHAKYNRN